jgi:hypothetical protein
MKSSGWKGIGYSVAVAVLVPIVVPIVVRASGPLARAAGKTGLTLYEKGREVAAEMGEVIEDLVAETKAEFAAAAVAFDEADDDSIGIAQPDSAHSKVAEGEQVAKPGVRPHEHA